MLVMALPSILAAAGYDLSLTLAKKDEDHVTGSLMAMFQAEGERVKEVK